MAIYHPHTYKKLFSLMRWPEATKLAFGDGALLIIIRHQEPFG